MILQVIAQIPKSHIGEVQSALRDGDKVEDVGVLWKGPVD